MPPGCASRPSRAWSWRAARPKKVTAPRRRRHPRRRRLAAASASARAQPLRPRCRAVSTVGQGRPTSARSCRSASASPAVRCRPVSLKNAEGTAGEGHAGRRQADLDVGRGPRLRQDLHAARRSPPTPTGTCRTEQPARSRTVDPGQPDDALHPDRGRRRDRPRGHLRRRPGRPASTSTSRSRTARPRRPRCRVTTAPRPDRRVQLAATTRTCTGGPSSYLDAGHQGHRRRRRSTARTSALAVRPGRHQHVVHGSGPSTSRSPTTTPSWCRSTRTTSWSGRCRPRWAGTPASTVTPGRSTCAPTPGRTWWSAARPTST